MHPVGARASIVLSTSSKRKMRTACSLALTVKAYMYPLRPTLWTISKIPPSRRACPRLQGQDVGHLHHGSGLFQYSLGLFPSLMIMRGILNCVSASVNVVMLIPASASVGSLN